MRFLLACTCLTPAVLLGATAAQAQRVIDTDITTPVATSTAAAGAPADIRITEDGSVSPTGGTAITIDSDNDVTNEGEIAIRGANGATGILAQPGRAGTITNSGDIIIDEERDADAEDGPFATGSDRHGIRIAPGGTFTGNVVNSGEIAVIGNDSAGIALDSRLDGSLTSSGRVAALGDRAAAIRTGDVTGDISLSGTIEARGLDAVGVAVGGDVGGALTVAGSIVSSGYRYTTPPSGSTDLDEDDLLQGGPALSVGGDVAGGILIAAPVPPSEDDDGNEVPGQPGGSIVSYGAAPAVRVGAEDRAIAIGAVEDGGMGLVIGGTIAGRGVYEGVDATGLSIGGRGGDVTIAGGMSVGGSVLASARDATATAVRLGAGARVDAITVGGRLEAGATGEDAQSAYALLIEEDAEVGTIRNSGNIVAAASGEEGAGSAIVDRSGTVSLVENQGLISASGEGGAVAIDLSTNIAGAVVRQLPVEQDVAAPRVIGDILFGAGDDLLALGGGTIAGTTRFGEGSNRLEMEGDAAYAGAVAFGAGADAMRLSGDARFSGSVDFGGGADILHISDAAHFSGAIAGGAGLAVAVEGGIFASTALDTVEIGSLSVGGDALLGISIDAATGASTLLDVAGAATFEEGARLGVRLSSIGGSEGRYTFLRAGTLEGAEGLSLVDEGLPFLFTGIVEADVGENALAVVISRRTAADIGLNRSESLAYDAILDALDNEAAIANVFLGVADGDAFRAAFRQMLPDHAGGAFDAVTQGSRATARFLMDPRAPMSDQGGWGFWLQQVAWGTSKDIGDTAAYDITGWGASGGAEIRAGAAGNVGLSLAYLLGRDSDGETSNEVRTEQIELAAHWRGQWGGLSAFARGSAALVDFTGTRRFDGAAGEAVVTRTATGDWKGRLYSVSAGVAHEFALGRVGLRPLAAIDYYRLDEDGYAETGGGDAFDLVVENRESDEFAATASLTLAYDLMPWAASGGWLRAEIEGGRRQIVGGALGATTARLAGGESFTLLPEDRADGWLGRLRLIGGGQGFSVGGEFSAEEQQGRAAVAFRVSLGLGL